MYDTRTDIESPRLRLKRRWQWPGKGKYERLSGRETHAQQVLKQAKEQAHRPRGPLEREAQERLGVTLAETRHPGGIRGVTLFLSPGPGSLENSAPRPPGPLTLLSALGWLWWRM